MSETVKEQKQDKVEFDVQLQPKDLYRFNIYQTYTGIQGWISVILGILGFVMAGITFGEAELPYTILYIVVGFLFLFYIPVSLWFRAKAVLKTNTVLAGKLHYEVSDEQIHVTQGEDAGDLPWEAIYKIVANKNQVLIYSTRINAYVVPREQIGDQYEGFCKIAKRKLQSYKLKMKN